MGLRASGVFAALGLVACAPELPPPVVEDCPEEDRVVAEACDDEYCGAPTLAVGVGISEHQPLPPGAPIPVARGNQPPEGGFHFNVSVEMERLCPVVFLRTSMQVSARGEGAWESVFDQERHVQSVRPEPEASSRQQYWGIQAFVPCEHWPEFLVEEDPPTFASCGDETSRAGPIDEFDVRIVVEAEDHDGRVGVGELVGMPTCCE